MTTLPRAVTSDELIKLRSENQSSRLYITVHQPATVYTARLSAVPASTDMVTSITYGSGSGTHTDTLADMTMYIGSTAGAYDLGMVRIRNTTGIGATSGTFNIAEESEIAWASNAYLTVVDEFSIWPRHIRLSGTTPYMDYDVAYVNQNRYCDSIPIMGPHRVLWLSASTVSTTFDASDSWALNNTITGYAWACATASASSGTSTATPTFTFNSAGAHRVSCTITNSDSATFTGYRYVFVVTGAEDSSPTLSSNYVLSSDFVIESLAGDYETGGYAASITLYDNAARAQIRDRALVIIHTRDTYGTSNTSAGFISGAENILFMGWIAGETIRRAADDMYSSVSFDVQGPQYWLGRIPAYAVGMKNSATHPSKWTRFNGLTSKAIVWHMLHWRTTITRCTDVFPLANTWAAARIEAPGAQTLWEQLKVLEYTTVLAAPCADRYGRLHNQVDQQLLDDTARAAWPTVMTLTGDDIVGEVEIERAPLSNASIVDLSGFAFDGTTASAYFSLSPGRVFRRYGASPEVVDKLILYDQDTTNTLCGRYSGWKNNEYPRLSLMLASNNRFVDIAPYSWLAYSMAATDTPRSIAKTFNLITRRVSFEYNNDGSYLLVRAECENEATADLAITGDAPAVIPEDVPPPDPPPPPPPDPIPTPSTDANSFWMLHTNAASDPPVAVIYDVLDDFNNPVYTAIIPPASLYIDELIFGNYVGGVLMIVAHATATPTGPGWAGGAGYILVRVDTPTTAPAWSFVGNFTAGMTTGVISDGCVPDAGRIGGTPFPNFTRTATGFNGICFHSAYFINKYLIYCGVSAAHTGGYTTGGVEGPLPIGANSGTSIGYSQNESIVYWNIGTGYAGAMPDYANAIQSGSTYLYKSFSIRGGSGGVYLYAARVPVAGGAVQIVRSDITGGGGGTLSWSSLKSCDETSVTYPYFSNTLNKSNYLNVIIGGQNVLYYTTDGATWSKMVGSTPFDGLAHYLQASGGNSLLMCAVGSGSISSGSEFARYTADVTDLTTNPWVQMTGNMWSGANKIMQSGSLTIVDSFLGF